MATFKSVGHRKKLSRATMKLLLEKKQADRKSEQS